MRILCFIFVCVIGLLAPLQIFLFCSLLYVFVWSSYELLVIACVVDVLFGTTTTSFLYTISTGLLIAVSLLIRPYLSWYTTQT